MEQRHIQFARLFNLSVHEAKIYLAGIESAAGTVSDLAKQAGIPRTAAYPPITSLLQKGFLESIKIKKRFYYRSVSPQHLKTILERKYAELDSFVDTLTQSINPKGKEIAVHYYEGREGVSIASDIFLNESKTKLWKIFEHPLHTLDKTSAWQIDDYVRRRVDKGIHARDIIPANAQSTWVKEHLAKDKEELRETIVISSQIYPFESTIVVCGTMIQLVCAKGDLFSILIENQPLAQTLSSIHDIAWDRFHGI